VPTGWKHMPKVEAPQMLTFWELSFKNSKNRVHLQMS